MSDDKLVTETERRIKLRNEVQSLAASVRYEKKNHPSLLNHECRDWPEYTRKRDELRSLEEADFL